MNIDKIKYSLHHHFRLSHGVTLTQAQLDDIHDHYHYVRKEAFKNVIYYRFVNMCLAIIMLIVFLFSVGYYKENWVAIMCLVVFIIYNMIHGLVNWIQYKRIKTPNRPSDEGFME